MDLNEARDDGISWTGQMLFLTPNQQCKSNEGTAFTHTYTENKSELGLLKID